MDKKENLDEKENQVILFDEESTKGVEEGLYNFYEETPVKKKKEPEEEEIEDDDIDIDIVDETPEKKGKIDSGEDEEEVPEEIKEHKQKFEQLSELGVLYLPENYPIPKSDEEWEKALTDSNQYRKQELLNETFGELPEDGKALLQYMLEGGKDINKFKETYFPEIDYNKIDITKEENQKKVLQVFYEKKGFSPEKAKKQVEIVENLMELETEATDALTELREEDKKNKLALIEEEKKNKALKETREKERWDVLAKTAEKYDDFGGGYSIGKKAKTRALESLYKQVKLEDGSVTTDFNYRLRHVVLQDPKLTLVLSDMLNRLKVDEKSKELYFDLSNFKRSEETKITKSIKEKLDSFTPNKFKGGSGSDSSRDTTKFWDRVL